VVVVDCGADHRLVDAADWERFYGTPPGPTGSPSSRVSAGRSPAQPGSRYRDASQRP
jgi:hypothetical protein